MQIAKQSHPWHDPLPVSPISWLRGWHRHHRQNNSESVWGVHLTQTPSSKNWIENQCDEDKVPAKVSDQLRSSVLVDGDNLKIVKEFFFLGTVVTSDNDISSEIRRRIVQGNRAYYGLHRLLRFTSRAHEILDISHIDSPGGSLQTRVLDHSSGACKRSGGVWATHPPDHLWRCVRAWSVEEKDEPRACWDVRRTEHPDGGEGWQDTMVGAYHENAGLIGEDR